MVVSASKVRTTAMGAVEPATGMVIWYSPQDTLSLLQGTCHKIHVARGTPHLYGHPAPPAAALVAAIVTLPCNRG